MTTMTLSNISKKLNAEHRGDDRSFQFVSTDSRTIKPGELFIALVGPNFDGHDYIDAARERGAVAAIVQRPVDVDMPLLQVKNTQAALTSLASLRRSQVNIPIVAITGSCGKTTTKTMIATILARAGSVLATEGTLNNDIGVPLTLLRLTEQHQFGVIELGANHAGEIAAIAALARPSIAVITNAAPVHLEGFKSLDGVARAKGEIYEALDDEGIAIVNADDAYASFWQKLIGNRKCITFGSINVARASLRGTREARSTFKADVCAKDLSLDAQGFPQFTLQTKQGSVPIHLSVLGQHNVSNALAAATVALQLGISLADIAEGLSSMEPVAKRLIRKQGRRGAIILDDTYNANPTSFKAALELLMQSSGEKILVVGDMAELGVDAEKYHRELGLLARKLGVQRFYAVGTLSKCAVTAFGENGWHFDDQQDLINTVQNSLHSNMTVLVKGSRSAKMENVVAMLVS
jgi:UDP-N-acetylmuramoyl-tripeptide--D-alanyl-D-alanine ligase